MIRFIRRLFCRAEPTMREKAERQAGKNILLHIHETTELRRLS